MSPITKLRANAQVAGGSVDSFNIKNRSILPEDLADDSFPGSILVDGSVGPEKLTDDVTVAGNTFNGPEQLVQTLPDGKLPVLDGSNLTNLKPIEAISTEDLTDVGGAVNTPLGLAKYDSAGTLPMPGSIGVEGYAELKGLTGIASPVGAYGRLYYNSSDGYLHFVNENGVDVALGVAELNLVNNASVTPIPNGIDTSFQLPVVPVEASVCVYLNGIRLVPSYDYTMNGAFINMTYAPKAGWQIRVDYRY